MDIILNLLQTLFSSDPYVVQALGPLAIAGLAAGGGGLLGAVAGGQDKKTTSSTTIAPETAEERRLLNANMGRIDTLEDLAQAGAGEGDVAAGAASQRSLATLLEQLQRSGGLPDAGDVRSSRQFAREIFQPQKQALDTSFREQEERVAQLAAQLGREVNDPILQAKLARSQTEQLGQIEAQQGAFTAQTARQMPLQRLNFAQGLASVRQGLASQAFANRQAIFNLGQQMLQSERNLRTAQTNTTQIGHANAGSVISGALAGAGKFAGLASGFSNLGGMGGSGGGGAVSTPIASPSQLGQGSALLGTQQQKFPGLTF